MLRILLLLGLSIAASNAVQKAPLTPQHLDQISDLLMLEDARRFDEPMLKTALQSSHLELRRRAAIAIGRIAEPRGIALINAARGESDPAVLAALTFATGQLKDEASILWLQTTLNSPHPAVAQQAARSLGKIQTPASAEALASLLFTSNRTEVIGEALLSLGRIPNQNDLAPILRWIDSPVPDMQWRVAWAFRNRNSPDTVPHLLKLSAHKNPEVRFWGVRKLMGPTASSARERELLKDPDRRVRAEAVRALGTYDDDDSFNAVLATDDSPDTWLSTFAAEAMARYTTRTATIIPKLIAASSSARPRALRLAILPVLNKFAPEAGKELEATLKLTIVKGMIPSRPVKSKADYQRIVSQYVLPDYLGRKRPRAIWETSKGRIELELYSGDAPLATDYFVTLTRRGLIDGTEFGRLVPNFVAQQRSIRDVNMIRDEVNLNPLTRGNLSWASRGLDTGPPGYTLGNTPQPHNEGNFTSLGRVIAGMDVVDHLELGDSVIRARMR